MVYRVVDKTVLSVYLRPSSVAPTKIPSRVLRFVSGVDGDCSLFEIPRDFSVFAADDSEWPLVDPRCDNREAVVFNACADCVRMDEEAMGIRKDANLFEEPDLGVGVPKVVCERRPSFPIGLECVLFNHIRIIVRHNTTYDVLKRHRIIPSYSSVWNAAICSSGRVS
jgi:hypothetical protein